MKGFPLPSSLQIVPGTEGAQAAYPYYMQFGPEDDARFWFYNSMHFPEPMHAFDSVTGEAAYCALGAANTRVQVLPTTKGIDERYINGRVYIGGVGVTDPAEIQERTEEFMQRAFYYYDNWETLYAQWKVKMRALIEEARQLPPLSLPKYEPLENVRAGKGIAARSCAGTGAGAPLEDASRACSTGGEGAGAMRPAPAGARSALVFAAAID